MSGLSAGIERDATYTVEGLDVLGWLVGDPRLTRTRAWAVRPGGVFDASAPLDAVGEQVVRGGVIVTCTAVGLALQDVPGFAVLTGDRALAAGLSPPDAVR